MARETTTKRRDDDDDDDVPATPKRGAAKDETKPTRGAAAAAVSLDDDDAIDAGLFSAGPATIVESVFAKYDYQGTSHNPPIVWLITFARGEGKAREQYEQPYGIGKNWALDKQGNLTSTVGHGGLPKTCNAIVHLVRPLKKALAKAEIDIPALVDPTVLEGLEVELNRVEQEVRNIQDKGGAGAKPRDDRGPRTILEIAEVTSAPWVGKSSGKGKGASTAAPKGRGRTPEPEPDEPDADDALTDDAIEAIVAVVEKGKVRVGEPFEIALEKVLKGRKNAGEVIDLATSAPFLKSEKGWTFDGKFVDAAE